MAKERLSMRNIRELLRLRFDCGLSQRDIARSLNLAPSTVSDYLGRAQLAQLSWPLDPELGDAELERQLFAPAPVTSWRQGAVPAWSEVHQELRKKGVTLLLLWQEYRSAHPQGFQYSWFCEHYRVWAGKLNLVMRQEHRAGEKCFVDYAGPTIAVIDPTSGEVREAYLFVAALGASCYTYAEATWTQSLPDWIASHVRMLQAYGGSPQILVPDNLKSAVNEAHLYEPELNETYREFARHYAIAIIPARPAHPRDKAKVEGSVLVAERWILARLRNQQFFSLSELNHAIAALLLDLNRRAFKKLPGSREAAFRSIDLPAMRPLPAQPYLFGEWIKARVNIDYHLEVARYYYSVPYALVGKQLDVRLTQNTVEIFHREQRVASHLRLHATKRYNTQDEHMPERHRAHVQWTPERMIKWAHSIGVHTAKLIEHVLVSRPHPQQGFRSALGILRLGKHYGCARLEAACRRAVLLHTYSYRSVESILKQRLDELPLPAHSPAQPALVHENLRGPEYFN